MDEKINIITYDCPDCGANIKIKSGQRKVLSGLFLGMVGDILLNMRNLFEGGLSNKVFAIGIFSFLTGHFNLYNRSSFLRSE